MINYKKLIEGELNFISRQKKIILFYREELKKGGLPQKHSAYYKARIKEFNANLKAGREILAYYKRQAAAQK